MSYSSTLLIEEVGGSGGTPGRSVTLVGPSLPFMGSEWGGKLNVTTTWYNGNGVEATQQVLGPEELPSKWQGEWNRTRMGRVPALYSPTSGGGQVEVVAPEDLAELLEDIFRGGLRLRVTWSQQGDTSDQQGRKVREGRATEWHFKYHRIQDIEWDVNFEWMGRGNTAPKVTSTRGNLVQNVSAKYLDKMQALLNAQALAQLQKFTPQRLTLGQLEALANYPTALTTAFTREAQQLQTGVQNVVNIARTLASQPPQIANRVVDFAQNTVSQVNNGFYDPLSRVPYELMTTRMKMDAFLRSLRTFGQTSDLARDAARAGQEFAQQLRQTVQATSLTGQITPTRVSDPNSVQRVHIVKDGDTAQRISQQYYGSPDHAVDINRANRLTWYTTVYPKGKILIIPALTQATTTQGA